MDAEKKRLVFIDALRGLAVFMMLECSRRTRYHASRIQSR